MIEKINFVYILTSIIGLLFVLAYLNFNLVAIPKYTDPI